MQGDGEEQIWERKGTPWSGIVYRAVRSPEVATFGRIAAPLLSILIISALVAEAQPPAPKPAAAPSPVVSSSPEPSVTPSITPSPAESAGAPVAVLANRVTGN